jgi:hypothetical protein
LTFDLKETLKIVGRIPPKTVWDYIKQVSDVANKEIILVSLLPASQVKNFVQTYVLPIPWVF